MGAMKEALGIADFDDESSVRERVHAAVAGQDHADVIAANLAKLLGAGEGGAPEEMFWAIRRFLEVRGEDQPVVVVFDDIHWGDPTFLDLVEHIADWSRDASILLLCMARPDLLDVREGWAGGKTNAATISLAPLSETECAELIDHLLGSSDLPVDVRARISGVAEGNPLFVEEMLRMLIDDGRLARDGGGWVPAGDMADVSVPPRSRRCCSARLDRLSEPERTLIEAAAVCGKEFHRGALLELLSHGRGDLDVHLRSLVRRELVTPERSLLPGEDAYRFRHLLIRDAAYDAIPKRERAQLHEAFAAWLERVAGERVAEQEEILGYHLESAYRLRMELGLDDDRGLELGAAAMHLAAAGRRSYARGDTEGAITLFSRAVDLLPVTDPERVRYGIELGNTLAWGGREVSGIEVLVEADKAAAAIGDLGLAMHASLALTDIGSWRDPAAWVRWKLEAERAIEVFEPAGDDEGLARAWFLLAWDHNVRFHFAERDRAVLRALAHAEAAGDRRLRTELLSMMCGSPVWGPTSVTEGLARCEDVLVRGAGSREIEAEVARTKAALEAMRGDIAKARELYSQGKAVIDELGRPVMSGFAVQEGWYIEMLARDFRKAEDLTRSEYHRLVEADSLPLQDITRDLLALSLCAQGRFEEADVLARETEKNVSEVGDVVAENVWRRVRAEIVLGPRRPS